MIDIKTYAVPKEGTTNKYYSTSNNSNAEPVNPFEPHYLWGQYFDDTQDIDGDMQVNGIVNADKLRSIYLETTNADIENADIENADINNASIVNLDADYGEIDNLSGINLNYSLATIISAYIKELSSDEITTENLTVTKSAHFFELVIDKIKAAGGALILTPADGFRIDIVQDVSDGKKLLFKATDGERAIRNMWQVNDQAICQTFNQAQVGTNYNVSNKYWWSLVTAVGTETINEEDYHYIVVSSTTKDGTLNPEEGDEVAMLGYRGNDDPNRQSAIYISAYTSLDDELVAPLICQYRGINDFNLASHKYTWFAAGVTAKGQSNGISANSIRGHLLLSSGLSVEDAINGQVVDITTYRILLNTTTIKVSDSSITPSTISATFLKNHNGDVQELSTVPVSLSVKLYGVVGSTEQILNTWNAGGTVTKQTTGLDIYDYLYFTLSDNSKTYDITSISIVADGQDGQDGQDGSSATNGGYWAFAYKSSKTQPAKPTGTGNTNGWSSTPTTPDYANGYYLWMSQCFVSGTGTYGEWTTPIRFTGDNGQAGEDGTKVEFIYAVNTSTTTPPAITYTAYNNKTRDDDDFVPAGWTDNPTGVQAQNEVEWVSTRVKEHGVWSDFSTPALWSKWGDKGTDGDGYEYIYKAQATQPSNPNNITTPASDSIGQTKYDDDFVPNGWSDEPVQLTSSTLYVWVSTRKKNSGSWGQFSAPKIWAHWSSAGSNGNTWAFIYNNSKTKPTKPNDGVSVGSLPAGWSTTITEPDYANGYYTWMSCNEVVGGTTYGAWSDPIRITGQDGKAGEDGTKIEFIYKLTSSSTTPSTPSTSQTDDYVPSSWTDNPTGVDETNQYEWVSTREKVNGTWSAFSTPALWSKWGEKGMDGDGYEYIYKHFTTEQTFENNNANPAYWNANQNDEYYGPSNYVWSDDPVGVNSEYQYEYVSVRKKEAGTWSKFSTPTLWSRYASRGANGGHYIFMYKNSSSKPAKPANGTNTSTMTVNGWSISPINPDFANGEYTWMTQCFLLDNQYGEWTDPIRITGENGQSGEDGTKVEFIYKRTTSSTAPSKPSTSQTDDYVPSGWTDNPTGVDETNQYEWVSTRDKENDTWSAFSTPALWSKWGEKGMDGDGYEYIYKATNTMTSPMNPANITQPSSTSNGQTKDDDDFVPNGWSDEPVQLSNSALYEWVSIRKKSNGAWQPFSTPKLWAQWSAPGSNGQDGNTWVFIYNNSKTKPTKPNDHVGIGSLPSGWSTTITEPNYSQGYYTWMSQTEIVGNVYGVWSDPIKITGLDGKAGEDGTKIEFIYKLTTQNSVPSTPSTSQTDDYVPSTWTDNPTGVDETNQYEWVSTRDKENGTWSAFSTPALWSKWGEKGMDGDGYEYIYKHFTTEQTFGSNNANPAYWTANQSDEYLGPSRFQWYDDPQGISSQYKYEYVAVRKKRDGEWGQYTTPKLWGKWTEGGTGQDGQDGQDGENAKQDLMLDCGSYCTITYNSSNKKYILSRRFAIAVFHHDGNTRIQVTDNTTPSRSDYAIYWKYNTRSGNMFEDDGINVSSDGVWYTDYDEDVQYNTLSSIPQFATYQLRTANGQAVLDQIIVYVKMAPAAVFEVTQDQIQSYVSGVMETVNGQITSIQNSISTLTQNYNSITATVRGITSTINGITGDLQQLEEDFSQISLDLNGFKTTVYKKTEVDGLISETQSMIQQTADNITLMVTNGLSQTGIDITNGTITLSASNTVVNGNLILQQINDVSQGFIFRNSNGEDGLKLTTDAVPALQNFIDQYPGYTRMLVGTNGFAWQSGNSNSTDRYLYVTSNDITLYSDSHYGKNNEGMSQIRIPLSGGQTGEIIDYIGDMNQSQVKTWYADSNSTTNVSFVESNVKVQHNGVRCVRLPSNATSAYYTFRPSSKDKVLLCYPTNGHRIRIDVGATGVIGNGSNIGHTYYIKIMSRASSNVKVELFGATFLPGDRDLENTLSTTFNITDNCIYTVIVLGNCEAGTTQYALVGRMQSGSYT